MHNRIEASKQEVLQAINNHRENILEEFLLMVNQLNEDFKSLLKNGIDEEKFYCLKGIKVEEPIYYTFFDRKMVESFQKVLSKTLKANTNAIQKFASCTTGKYIKLSCEYLEIQELILLAQEDQHAKDAINLMNL